MIINRSHWPWVLLVVVVSLLLSAEYLEVFRPGLIPEYLPVWDSLGRFPLGHRSVGATPLGIAYGTAAFLIFIFATLLRGRKKVRHWRIGRAETWMRAHIWLSVLTVPLVAFHCGLRSGSLFTTGLLILYGVVMVSGIYGLVLQQFLPRQMMDRLSHEVIYDQIPFLRKSLVESAMELRDELAPPLPTPGIHIQRQPFRPGANVPATAVEIDNPKDEETRAALREALATDVMPYLRARRTSRLKLAHRQTADNWFYMLRISVPEEYRAKVDEMRRWCDERRQMDLQSVMHHWLHYWLMVHVPASLLLLIWTAWHAVTGLFYY